MRTMYRGSVIVLALILGIWSFSEVFPETTSYLIVKAVRTSQGIEVKKIKTKFGVVHYQEGGKGPTVLLLHGMYGSKDSWLHISNYLVDSYRVIMIDIPGFGDNKALDKGGYALDLQTERLVAVANALNLKNFHLAGNTLGGQMAAMLTLKIPQRVKSLAFIGGTTGVRYPPNGELADGLIRVKSRILVITREDFKERLKFMFPSGKTNIYRPVLRAMEERSVRRMLLNVRIWKETVQSMKNAVPLVQIAPALSQPTLVVWCQHDPVFHIEDAVKLAHSFSRGRVVKLSGCGSAPMIDKAEKTGAIYRKFLKMVDR